MKITFEPLGRKIEVAPDTTLLEAARLAGIQIASLCGGVGLCESCIVHIHAGDLNSPTLEEQSAREQGWLQEGQRLACQAIPQSDVVIDVPLTSLSTQQRLQLEGVTQSVTLDPPTRIFELEINHNDQPSPDQIQARVLASLKSTGIVQPQIDPSLLPTLPESVRAHQGEIRLVLRKDEAVAILTQGEEQLGLAIDLGTTKIGVYLINLETGETLSRVGFMNPQISYGEDVISRIAYANQGEEHRQLLQTVVVEHLNDAIDQICKSRGIRSTAVVEGVVVGNTVMHHAFLGLPLRQLGVAPYEPAETGFVEVKAHEVGLSLAPGATLYLPANIAGYVGADHTAMILASGFGQEQGAVLAVDIGTNTEISLQSGGRILSCSCASGPAFEGAHVRDGMRAGPGAIERVQPSNGGLRWQTVDEQAPVGICGSGILDALAALRSLGWIDRSGRIVMDQIENTQYQHPEGVCLVPASGTGHDRDIVITREDIHEVQLAQGAIRAGIEVLLGEADIVAQDLERVCLAGAFGTYLNVSSAMQLGMLPKLDPARIQQVGNAAGEGARQLLLSVQKRREVSEILDRVLYVELTTHPRFTELFTNFLYLG